MGLLSSQDSARKPLASKYFSRLKKEKTPAEDMYDVIHKIRLSGSGEWIMIEGEHCTALLHAESKVGQDFWAFATQLEGELKALKLIPSKGKLGFDVVVHDDLVTEYHYDSLEDVVSTDFLEDYGGMMTTGGLSSGLKIQDMLPPSNPSLTALKVGTTGRNSKK